MTRIFISYSRKDSACVYKIATALERDDFGIWIDKDRIELTGIWLESIEKGIEQAQVFMLFWSAGAKESRYVAEEIRLARGRIVAGQMKLLTVMLDDTPLPTALAHTQAADLRHGCSDIEVANFINQLPAVWRSFSWTKPLGQQAFQPVGENLVAVLLDEGNDCKAYIVGAKEAAFVSKPAILNVCLQFTRAISVNMLDDVVKAIPHDTPIWMLHITGPNDGKDYTLPDDPAIWEACARYIQATVRQVADEGKTTLRIFTPMPAALLAASTRGFERFWHVQFFHFWPGQGYKLMIDQPRR